MGTWGTGLYSDDLTVDLRDDFAEVIRAPWDGDALMAWAASEYPMLDDPADDSHTDVRLALADLFWTYGVEHPATFEAARQIIAEGSDLAAKRALGMAERDVERRAVLLERLRQRWTTPNPRPRPRRVLASPEPFLFEEGECFVYPTSRGEPLNPYVTLAREPAHYRTFPWRHDGWGAAIVLALYRQYEVFARYGIALLASIDADKPTLADLGTRSILHTEAPTVWPPPPDPQDQPATTRRVHGIAMSSRHRERMRVESVGRLTVDSALVAAEISPQIELRRLDNQLANVARVAKRLVSVEDPISRWVLEVSGPTTT